MSHFWDESIKRAIAARWKGHRKQTREERLAKMRLHHKGYWALRGEQRLLEYGARYRDDPKYRAHILRLAGESYRRTAYGVTPSEYRDMVRRQDGRCAICKEKETARYRGKVRQLAIDHNHRTGKVRALLCYRCNAGIGFFGDRPELVRAAVCYLENHQ